MNRGFQHPIARCGVSRRSSRPPGLITFDAAHFKILIYKRGYYKLIKEL